MSHLPTHARRPAGLGEVCICARPAVVVFTGGRFADIGYCGAPSRRTECPVVLRAAPPQPLPAPPGAPGRGAWPRVHRVWCDRAACQFDPERSGEGTHVGPETTLAPAGAGRVELRLVEPVPGGPVGVALLVTAAELDARGAFVEVTAGVDLTVPEATKLAELLVEHAEHVEQAERFGGVR